jgi:acyl-ACP thioesterase
MGLDWSSQHAKIKAHSVLATCMAIRHMQMPGDDQVREHVFLLMNRVNYWLATINSNRVAKAIRAKVIEYQTECADVLFAHFFGKGAAAPVARRDQERGARSQAF